jgi:hypothetical protein
VDLVKFDVAGRNPLSAVLTYTYKGVPGDGGCSAGFAHCSRAFVRAE